MQTLTQQLWHDELASIRQSLAHRGIALLRDTSIGVAGFSELMNTLCHSITFDPARARSSDNSQRVDAGTAAVGLHIENGNTPLPPDIIAFYSQKSAHHGAQTTWCDGAELYRRLPGRLQQLFMQPIIVKRCIDKPLWQRYVANARQCQNPDAIRQAQLLDLLKPLPGQSAKFDKHGNCSYTLTIHPIINTCRTGPRAPEPGAPGRNTPGLRAFANALLGPSFNYQPPTYCFTDGSPLRSSDLQTVAMIAETCIHEINWRDGDIAILDNKRVMHGRRAITVPLSDRQLLIGMGHYA